MRDRLIELIDYACNDYASYSTEMAQAGNYGIESMGEFIAAEILADGWIRPPMRIGQICYIIRYDFSEQKDYIEECKVSCITQKKNGEFTIRISETKYSATHNFSPEEIGETIFLTKEEAEQVLKGDVK